MHALAHALASRGSGILGIRRLRRLRVTLAIAVLDVTLDHLDDALVEIVVAGRTTVVVAVLLLVLAHYLADQLPDVVEVIFILPRRVLARVLPAVVFSHVLTKSLRDDSFDARVHDVHVFLETLVVGFVDGVRDGF